MLTLTISAFALEVPLLLLLALVVCYCAYRNLPALTQTIAIWRQGKMIGVVDSSTRHRDQT